jgi:hypothetical protein
VKAKYWIGMVLVCMLISSCLAFGQRLRLPEGTLVRVRLKADLASDQVAEATRVDFEVARPVVIQGTTVIPEGAVSWGAVQSVKKGKFIKFDIEGVQLPDGSNVKLRSAQEKSKNPEIKVDSDLKDGVGAAKGTEFTAYVDEGIEVAASAPPGLPAPTAAATAPPTQAEAPPPAPAQAAAPSASAVTPAVTPPAVTTAATSPAVSPAPLANVERVTVECYSDPSAADIMIDGEFYGNTPSILKIPVGRHDLQIQLSGYKTYAIPLTLQSGTPRRIRASLEPKE